MTAKHGASKQGEPTVISLNGKAEVQDYVERRALQLVGEDSKKAFRMLDRGQLEGTRAAMELTSLRDMLARKPR